MNFLENLISSDVLNAVGWTLIHSIWQIALVGILLKGLLYLLKNKTTELRYWISLSAILVLVLFSVKTFTIYFPDTYPNNGPLTLNENISLIGSFTEDISMNKQTSENSIFRNVAGWINHNTSYIAGIWILGIVLFSLRLGGSFWFIQRMKRRNNYPLNEEWNYRLEQVKQKLKISKSIKLLESSIAKIPMVIGHFKPVILLPIGLISSLPCEQVEAIIAHELAHIKRKDYLINLIKSLLEVIFFFHPVFWWISSVVDTERENCSDDLTLNVCDEKSTFQKALLNIQDLNNKPNKLAAALYQNEYQLLKRIKRMKTKNQFNSNQKRIKHRLTGSLAGIAIVITGIIVFTSTSAFSPGQSEIPNNDQVLGIISPAITVVENNTIEPVIKKPVSDVKPQEINIQKVPGVRIPDSVKKEPEANRNIQMEINEEGNLVKITRNGKELQGEEKEKYENLVNRVKEIEDEEHELQIAQEEIDKSKEQLYAAQEKMDEAVAEYNTAMEFYYQSLATTLDDKTLEVWSLAEDDYAKALALSKLTEDQYNDITWNFTDDWTEFEEFELQEQLKDINIDEQFDISMDLYEDALRLQELEMDLIQDKIDLQIDKLQDIKLLEKEMDIFENRIRSELVEDNLLKNDDDELSFEISRKKLEVNGKKQSKALHEKYLRLCEDLFGGKFDDDKSIMIIY